VSSEVSIKLCPEGKMRTKANLRAVTVMEKLHWPKIKIKTKANFLFLKQTQFRLRGRPKGSSQDGS